jgi:hypothetical protein
MSDFEFYNANPLSKIEGDCVYRAINTATGIPYYEIAKKLKLVSELFECDELCVCCYQHFLEDVLGLTRHNANGATVGEIAKEFQDYIVLIRTEGHLTMSEYGIVYDIWDCTNEIADIFWLVK